MGLVTEKSRSESTSKRASVMLLFEAGDLFVQVGVDGFGSMELANQFIAAGPKIAIENEWVYLRYPSGELLPIFRDYETDDECGRWIEGADRESLDGFLDSLLPIPEFLKHNLIEQEFVLHWRSIAEWSLDRHGRPRKLLASTAGLI